MDNKNLEDLHKLAPSNSTAKSKRKKILKLYIHILLSNTNFLLYY